MTDELDPYVVETLERLVARWKDSGFTLEESEALLQRLLDEGAAAQAAGCTCQIAIAENPDTHEWCLLHYDNCILWYDPDVVGIVFRVVDD